MEGVGEGRRGEGGGEDEGRKKAKRGKMMGQETIEARWWDEHPWQERGRMRENESGGGRREGWRGIQGEKE